MGKSIKSNFIYNMVNTISGLLFPLITFPYVSRVIMAEGIGQVQFFTSIINYIVLLTSIGIPMYGIREIARVRDDKTELSRTTTEIITLNLLLNVLGYTIVAILCYTMPQIQVNLPLFALLSTSIVLTTIGCPWFFRGIEDFKYITIRGVAVKIICVVLLFILVKTKEDLLYYGAYTVLGQIGDYLINFIRLRKFIYLRNIEWKLFNPFRHLKPALAIFVFNIITSIYVNLDSVMLGMLDSAESVGYYTAATKLSHMLVALVTSLGAVMLPRLSNLIKNNQTDEFYRLADKSYRFILMLAFPVCIGLTVLASSMIRLFSGDTFAPAIMTLQIMAPIIIAIGISNLIGIQILYPLGKIKFVTYSTCIGALVNFSLNLILIPGLCHNGAAIATLLAECFVTITQIIIASRFIPVKMINLSILKYLFCSMVMGGILVTVLLFKISDICAVILLPLLGVAVYCLGLYLLKDKLCYEIVTGFMNALKSRR